MGVRATRRAVDFHLSHAAIFLALLLFYSLIVTPTGKHL